MNMNSDTKIIDAINSIDSKWISFEYFPPRTELGLTTLYKLVNNMKSICSNDSCQPPLFADFTWGAGGSTSSLTFELCSTVKQKFNLNPNMHLTCTNMDKQTIDDALENCKKNGIRNIVALRGDPPLGEEKWKDTTTGFNCALDLVKYIRKEHGDFFCISVSGYPEGHPNKLSVVEGGISKLTPSELLRYRSEIDENGNEIILVCKDEDFEDEFTYLKEKVDAGADLIITQMFFDTNVFNLFMKKCRAIGITVPIIPGIMCIAAYNGFKRMTSFCKTRVLPETLAALELLKHDDILVKQFGIEFGTKMCKELLKMNVHGLHFYTLNMGNVTLGILERLGFIPVYSISENMIQDLSFADIGRNIIDTMKLDLSGFLKYSKNLTTNLYGARISICLPINAQNAIFVEILLQHGAAIQWTSPLATSDFNDEIIAAAITTTYQNTKHKISIYCPTKNATKEEKWLYLANTLIWRDYSINEGEDEVRGPHLILDEAGDISLLLILIMNSIASKDVTASSTSSTSNTSPFSAVISTSLISQLLLSESEVNIISEIIIKRKLNDKKSKLNTVRNICITSSTGLQKIRVLQNLMYIPEKSLLDIVIQHTLLVDASESSVCMSKIGQYYTAKHKLPDYLCRATDVMIAGKRVLIIGYDDTGKGCANALKSAGAFVSVVEYDPICALQAAMEGFTVTFIDNCITEVDIIIITNGIPHTITLSHMKVMKNNTIIVNMGSTYNNSPNVLPVDLISLQANTTCCNIKPGVDRYVFPDGHGVLLVGSGTSLLNIGSSTSTTCPAIIASMKLTGYLICFVNIWNKINNSNSIPSIGRLEWESTESLSDSLPYSHDPIFMSYLTEWDEMIAFSHLDSLGVELTTLQQEQYEYIGVPVGGPFKKNTYRY